MKKEAANLRIYNSLTGEKNPFVPMKAGKVGIYACGVTTYDHYHIGHALQALYFDMIRNYLEYLGFEVNYVRNYTDVDDKIIARAKDRGMTPKALVDEMIASGEEDMHLLGCKPPSASPRVSESIPQIIEMINEIIEKGYAYETSDGDVYFKVRAKSDYGKLSHRNPDDLRSGSRDLKSGEKEDPLDFALWKKDDSPGASWSSPWGQGRPGWHIECSVMSRMHLGHTFDIHGGGRDLVFPHHENELAQSEAAHDGACYAKVWMHSGLLTIENQKMSKSLGNHLFVKDFLKQYPAEVLRLAFFERHYRSNVDFKRDTFTVSFSKLCSFYNTLAVLHKTLQEAGIKSEDCPVDKDFLTAFTTAMNDDFNTPHVIGLLFTTRTQINALLLKKKDPQNLKRAASLGRALVETAAVFGLFQNPNPASYAEELKLGMLPHLGISEAQIQSAIEARLAARSAKNFLESDRIRADLKAKGIELLDTPTTTEWTVSPELIPGGH